MTDGNGAKSDGSGFKSDHTSSNQTGVTLMNNQSGYTIAHVMSGKEGVTIRELPSMIRVDGIGKIDFDFDELGQALGWEFSAHDFEEVMSTHYGRMVVLDDRVLFFANPEDAAEYLGFDLQPVAG
jgi:propane monooxygenase coupling protein